MPTARPVTATLLICAITLASSLPATSAPLMTDTSVSSAGIFHQAENVRYYGRRGGYYYGGHHHHHGGNGAGLAIGLAAGALVGGAIAASQAQAQQNAAYCAQRYRSYDPRSGTYLNVDGNRYPCP